jgi:hypothetical protein
LSIYEVPRGPTDAAIDSNPMPIMTIQRREKAIPSVVKGPFESADPLVYH